jgi:hypothetical protein
MCVLNFSWKNIEASASLSTRSVALGQSQIKSNNRMLDDKKSNRFEATLLVCLSVWVSLGNFVSFAQGKQQFTAAPKAPSVL